MTYKGYIQGFKGFGLKDTIESVAWINDLSYETKVTKGWLQETVFFKVSGEDKNVEKFKKEFKKLLDS